MCRLWTWNEIFSALCVSKKQEFFHTVFEQETRNFPHCVLLYKADIFETCFLIAYLDCFDCTHSQALSKKQGISHTVFEQERRQFLHCVVVQSWYFWDTFCSLLMWIDENCTHVQALSKKHAISPHCVWGRKKAFSTLCSCTKLRFVRHVLLITHVKALNKKHTTSHTVFEQETRHFLHCVVVQSWDFRDTFCSLVMCEWVPKSCWVLHIDQLLKKGEMRKKKKTSFA